MTGQLIINSQDAWTTWRACLEKGSVAKLISGITMKDDVENDSPLEHGKRVLLTNRKMASRDVTLTFIFTKKSTTFLSRVAALQSLFKDATAPVSVYVNMYGVSTTYKLIFVASSSAVIRDDYSGSVTFKLTEPNPSDR